MIDATLQAPTTVHGRPRPPAHLRTRPRPRVTLDQLHTFVAVAERQHISRAAAALGLSQSSVSTVVRRLERTLDLPLFQRIGRNVRLTDAGRALRPIALRILDDATLVDQLQASFTQAERGEITVATGHVVGTHRVPAWLAGFVAAHPSIQLHMKVTSFRAAIAMLADGEADVIFTGSAFETPGIDIITMERHEMVLVAAPSHPLSRSRAPMRELSRYRNLEHEAGTATSSLAAQFLGKHARGADAVELEEGALVPALLAGLGFAVMPRGVVEADVAAGRLTILPCSRPRVLQSFTAARRHGAQTPAVELLWGHLGAIAQPH
ncbi:MAG TPA: LysR family transcriptional regulator [Candidatus Binatia bacterium]|nr:LysR family transcriptional regulator [Candidatus Binatia bacterium]